MKTVLQAEKSKNAVSPVFQGVFEYASTLVYGAWFYGPKRTGKTPKYKSVYKITPTKLHFRELKTVCTNGASELVSNLAGGITAFFMNHLMMTRRDRCQCAVDGAFSRTPVLLTGVLFALSFIFGEVGLWSSRTVTEIFSLVVSAVFVFIYKKKYEY